MGNNQFSKPRGTSCMIVISFSVSVVAPILDGLVLNHTVERCRLHEIFGDLEKVGSLELETLLFLLQSHVFYPILYRNPGFRLLKTGVL